MHADFYEQILTHICSAESIAGNTFLQAISNIYNFLRNLEVKCSSEGLCLALMPTVEGLIPFEAYFFSYLLIATAISISTTHFVEFFLGMSTKSLILRNGVIFF